jgi:hypothetical protein
LNRLIRKKMGNLTFDEEIRGVGGVSLAQTGVGDLYAHMRKEGLEEWW